MCITSLVSPLALNESLFPIFAGGLDVTPFQRLELHFAECWLGGSESACNKVRQEMAGIGAITAMPVASAHACVFEYIVARDFSNF